MTVDSPEFKEPNFDVLYKRIEKLKTEELFQEPYDPPEYLNDDSDY
jgi:hypothetical protein